MKIVDNSFDNLMHSSHLELESVSLSFTQKVIFGLLCALLALSWFLGLNRDSSAKISSFLSPNYRQVLSIIETSNVAPDTSVKIIKVQSKDGISVEIYSIKSDARPLLAKLNFPKHKEAHLLIEDQISNLALKDLNGDNYPEIIAPSLDEKNRNRLNVYTFDHESNSFIKYSESN